jgi:hypothetical protein
MAEKKKSEELNPILVDKRLVERQIRKGRLSSADFEKHLSGLADVGEKAESIATIVYPTQGN